MDIKVQDDCVKAFNDFKYQRNYDANTASQFIIFGFPNIPNIGREPPIEVIHREAVKFLTPEEKNAHWAKMIEMLPENEVRFVVTNVHYEIEDIHRTKMVFIFWCPENINKQMNRYCHLCKNSLTKAFGINKVLIEAATKDDLDLISLLNDIKK